MSASDMTSIDVGDKCLVIVAQQRFMVNVLAMDDESLHLSFPGIDYPVAGMSIEAEFHDDQGFSTFTLTVLRGPEKEGEGMLLEMPSGKQRILHRSSVRVPADLGARVRGPADVKYTDARVVNLSTGGALVETSAVFALGVLIELVVQLSDDASYNLQAEIVHVGHMEMGVEHGYLYGVRVVEHAPGAGRAITQYVWRRLKELFPAG